MTTPVVATRCFEEPGSLCAWVYEHTGNDEQLASLADWFVERPLRILIVIVVAWVAARLARRAIRRVVPRLANPRRQAIAGLERVGLPVPGRLAVEVHDSRRRARVMTITSALSSAVTVTIWTLAVITILAVIGIEIGPLLAGAGIAGVALGFGAQSLVKDCIAGMFMLIEDQFGIGDIVDLGEASGVVEQIALRTTVLRGHDGTVWHVPNGVVQRVGNRSQQWSVAVLDVDVSFDANVATVREVLGRAAAERCAADDIRADVLDPPEVVGVEALGTDRVTLRLTVRVNPGAQFTVQRALREHVKQALQAAHIEMAPNPLRPVVPPAGPSA